MLESKLAADFLRLCQVTEGDIAGTECPWELNAGMDPREDYHDTLEAVYIWSLPENISSNRKYIENALKYLRFRFEAFKGFKEPVKSYDAAYITFSLGEYRKNSGDRRFDDMIEYAEEYLTDYFTDQPGHNLRDYSNAYWKAGLFGNYLKSEGKDTGFIRKWLEQDLSLISPMVEVNNEGPGYMFHHDFASVYGTKLYAMGVLMEKLDLKGFEATIPTGFVKRRFDEVAFNSIVMTGLLSVIPLLSGGARQKAIVAVRNIEKEIDSRVEEGGLKRGGDYFHLRESWPTFFYAYASRLLMDAKL